MLKIFFYYFMF